MVLSCQKNQDTANTEVEKDDPIEKIISSMTLEEKVGQMTNLTLATIAEEKDGKLHLDTTKALNILVDKHIGSIQNVISHAYHLDEWHRLVGTLQEITLKKTRHKIPFLYCIDAVHGANYVYGATLFPHNIGLGATRNPELVKQCATITAKETRAAGIRYNFSPVLDVGRNQQWSRFGETFGEDVYLVSKMGLASINGYEGNDVSSPYHVASCMKHFIGYSVPENGRDRAPAYIPEIVLREYFLPPFDSAVKAGAHTLMVNSAEVNGIPVHASKFLLTDLLRGELGYQGVIISDWQDILKLHERHRVAKNHKEAVHLSVNAGIDICIVPYDLAFYNDLIELVKEDKIKMSRIDESVRRILKLKKSLGLFEAPEIEKQAIAAFARPEYKEVSLQAARESITLLKNEDSLLPLKQGTRLLVTGPAANSVAALHGAWSYSWQGDDETLYPDSSENILQALIRNFKVNFLETGSFNNFSWNNSKLTNKAKNVDIIIACLGEPAYAETPGNIQSLDLDPKYEQFIDELKNTGKPIVLILTEGRPRIIRNIEPNCAAIILAYWPGPEGPRALSEIISGKTNPSGKLPFTYPKYSGTLQTYDHKLLDEAIEIVKPEYQYYYKFDPQFTFGHGLSYTSFQYRNLSMSSDSLMPDKDIQVTLEVINNGNKKGMEVVELFSRDLYANISPSVKRLRKFKKIELDPGEKSAISFNIEEKDLSFVNQDLIKVCEEGKFEIMVENLRDTIYYIK